MNNMNRIAKKKVLFVVHKKLENLKTISKKDKEKLQEAGFQTLESICWIDESELMDILGKTKKEIEEITQEALSLVTHKPVSAIDLLKKEEKKQKITTGSKQLDDLLGGGIFTKEITEISGEFAAGKTQLCFQLTTNVQLSPEKGGINGAVYYIDTEGTFSSTRIAQMASEKGLNPKEILKNIAVTRTYNSDHLVYLVKNAPEIIESRNIKLLIIDSIASHFRAEYIGEGNLVKRQQRVMSLAETLKRMLEDFNIAIVVTNQVIATIDESVFDQSPHPALGFAWAHRPHQRILLRKGRGEARIARLYDSSRLPDRECVFFVTKKGIEDKKS